MKRLANKEKHFCASVWVLTKHAPKKVLLVFHQKLDKWQQPGGHIEKFENPIEAAIRELREETGVDIDFLLTSIKVLDRACKLLPLPDFIVEQKIPKYKNCPSHFHLDMQFIVVIQETKLKFNKKESKNIGWFTKKEALELPLHKDNKEIIKKIMLD
jgi:8-oxo-dGTP pyrophosphatase MutT (NUDIX family)